MALKISLKPGERFVVNGAVITNGDRRSAFIIQNKVSILRERDILRTEDVNTPARRIYFPIMLSYLEPEKAEHYHDEFVLRMSEFLGVIANPEIRALCVDISMQMTDRDFYKALANCRKLLDYEIDKLAPFTEAA
jgi:flagellar biosynthesis repressor protein FlbT